MSFEKALDQTLRFEGGFSNHKADPGGATMKGVTQSVYDADRDHAGLPRQSVKFIGDDELRHIYERDYWRASGANGLAEPLDALHFDAAVNHGLKRAGIFLTDSGGSPKKYLDVREIFYHNLVNRKPEMRVFLRGWLARVKSLREFIAK